MSVAIIRALSTSVQSGGPQLAMRIVAELVSSLANLDPVLRI